jgi:hypothetical protein
MVFGLIIEFIERLRLVTTNNYTTLTKLHTLHIIIKDTKLSQFILSSSAVAW